MRKTLQWIVAGIGISALAAAVSYAGTTTAPRQDVVKIAPQSDEAVPASGSIIITTYYADATLSGPQVGSCVRITCSGSTKGVECNGVKTRFFETTNDFCDGDGPR